MSGARTKPRRRVPLLLLLGVAHAAAMGAAVLAACSSDDGADLDGGSPEASSVVEAGRDGGAPPSDAGIAPGQCTQVKGACDLVVQDCPDDKTGQKQECVVTGSGTSYTTACQPVQASQQLPIGRACCSNAPSNECLPGLTCVGRACEDGGPKTGRCSPACCQGDDQKCKRSEPEGITGKCDLVLVAGDSNTELHRVCSYRERCAPFGQEPCRAGQMCLVEDQVGTASCLSSFDKKLGETCTFSNECADGLYCLILQGQDAGLCRMMCLTPGAQHPFDASVEDGGPYKGGCPVGSACSLGPFQDLPSWLSFCRIDGG